MVSSAHGTCVVSCGQWSFSVPMLALRGVAEHMCHARETADNPGAASSLGEEAMSPAGANRGTQQPSRDAATFTRRLQTCISNTIAAHPRSSLKTSPAFSHLQTAVRAPSQLLWMERQKHLSDSEC